MSAGSPESKALPAEDEAATNATPALAISPEKVCFIVVKASEFDAKDMVTIPDDGSNATDDAMMSVLEDHADDLVAAELRGFIGALTEDEQVDLGFHQGGGALQVVAGRADRGADAEPAELVLAGVGILLRRPRYSPAVQPTGWAVDPAANGLGHELPLGQLRRPFSDSGSQRNRTDRTAQMIAGDSR